MRRLFFYVMATVLFHLSFGTNSFARKEMTAAFHENFKAVSAQGAGQMMGDGVVEAFENLGSASPASSANRSQPNQSNQCPVTTTQGFNARGSTQEAFTCAIDLSTAPKLDDLFKDITGPCIPEPEENAFRINSEKDLCTCSCLNQRQDTLHGKIVKDERDSNPSLSLNSRVQALVNRNIGRLNAVLEGEQNGMRFQGSTLPSSDAGASLLASLFTTREEASIRSSLSGARSEARKVYQRLSDTRAPGSVSMREINISEPDAKLLAPDDRPEYNCLPFRTFMVSKQIPEGDLFDGDLAQESTYEPDKWDYQKLRTKFVTLSENANTLDRALENVEAAKVFQRMQFLERNPIYKNFFSSTHPDPKNKRAELWSKIHEAYGTGKTGKARITAFNKLRAETGAFFTDPKESKELDQMIQNGANRNLRVVLDEVPRRVGSLTGTYDPQKEWDEARSDYTKMNSERPEGERGPDLDFEKNGRDIPQMYAFYCSRIEFQSRLNQWRILEDLEGQFASYYTSDLSNNTDYVNAGIGICQVDRKSKDGSKSSNFSDFKEQTCRLPENRDLCTPQGHEKLLAKFLEEYPNNPEGQNIPTDEEIETLLPFLKGEARVPVISREDAVRSGSEGRRHDFSRRNDISRNLSSINSGFNDEVRNISSGGSFRETNVSSEATTTSPAQAQTSRQNQQGQQQAPQNQIAGNIPFFIPDQQTAAKPSEESTAVAETSQRRSQKSDENIESIRGDLAALNRDLARENSRAGGERNDQTIADLNARLDSLTRRLEEAQRTNRSMRDQIAEAEEKNKNPRPSQTSPDAEVRRSPASFQPQVSAAGNAQSQNDAPQINSPQTQVTGGGGSSFVSGISRPTTVLSSGNSALLAKYGVQSGTVQGALIVANNSSSIDYQSLRSQSAESVIPLSLSPEEFNLIARNDQSVLNRYLDRVRAMPGNVIRLDVSASGIDGKPLEFFVLKNGNDFSIVPGANSTPSRTPASLPAGAREFTLRNLRQELGN